MERGEMDACRKAFVKIQNGDWNGAHNIVQDLSSPLASRMHGLLHWQEGDLFNARYWYRVSGTTFPSGTIEEEVESIGMEISLD